MLWGISKNSLAIVRPPCPCRAKDRRYQVRSGQVTQACRKDTVNRYRTLLSLVYSLANRNGKVSVNPARLVRLRKENNARVRFLDDQEETNLRAKIREAFPNREPEFDLALHTGMRLSEQYRLAWGTVDLKRGMLTIPRSKHGEKRFITLNSAAQRALKILGHSPDGSGLVCSPLAGPERR